MNRIQFIGVILFFCWASALASPTLQENLKWGGMTCWSDENAREKIDVWYHPDGMLSLSYHLPKNTSQEEVFNAPDICQLEDNEIRCDVSTLDLLMPMSEFAVALDSFRQKYDPHLRTYVFVSHKAQLKRSLIRPSEEMVCVTPASAQ